MSNVLQRNFIQRTTIQFSEKSSLFSVSSNDVISTSGNVERSGDTTDIGDDARDDEECRRRGLTWYFIEVRIQEVTKIYYNTLHDKAERAFNSSEVS